MTEGSGEPIGHSAHWGSFRAIIENGRFADVQPFPGDPSPGQLIASMPGAVHARSRIDRPYVRQGWLRGDRAGGTFRGGEPFVPVSWDAAIRLVSGEIARIHADHGPAAIFGGSNGWSSAGRFHHAKSQLQRMLAASGGYTGGLTNYSYGAGMTLMPHLVGNNECIEGPVPDWRAICRHARIMVCFGGMLLRNGQIINGGGGRHEMEFWLREAAAAGVRMVYVSPIRSDMPSVGAEWIPIRPNTDAAMMLAMMNVLISSGRHASEFVDTYTVGFRQLHDEVIGRARTPEWAEPITGVPSATIRRLAFDLVDQPSMMTANWSLQRAEFGEQPFWALLSLACLVGRIGQPGLGFSFGHGSMGGMGSPRAQIRSVGLPTLANPSGSNIPAARIADMLENPGAPYDYNGKRCVYPDIRMIHWAGGNPFHHHQDLNRFQRAWARAETIVVQEPWWTSLARHADIVLPATTTLERNDIASGTRDRFIIAMKQAIPAQGQARHDFDMLSDIADCLGVREQYTEGRDEGEWLRHLYETCRSAAALKNVALTDFDAFWEQGHVEIAMPDEVHVPFKDFLRDPNLYPLKTETGRFQLFSRTIADFNYPDCPGHATWIEPTEYLGAPLAQRYPLHMLSVQPSTRLHGQLDMAGASKSNKIEGREPITMNKADADARGLEDGDIVRVFNDRGACLAGVRTTSGLFPNVVVLPTGAWFDPLDPGRPGSLCVHGNPNILTNDVGTSRLGQGSSAQSCLVQVERWSGPLPDIKVHDRPEIAADTAAQATDRAFQGTSTMLNKRPISTREMMVFKIAQLLKGCRHVCVGASSPIPGAGALLAKALADDAGDTGGRMHINVLGSLRHNSFTSGAVELFDAAAQGRMDAFFLGGGQIDGQANINLVGTGGDYPRTAVRWSGSHGSAYLYYLVPRVILFREEHSRRVFVPKVDFVSAPGPQPDGVYRPGGPLGLLTSLCWFSFDKTQRRFTLQSVHPGHTVEEVRDNTAFDFDISERVGVTEPPDSRTLDLLRGRVASELKETYPTFVSQVFSEVA